MFSTQAGAQPGSTLRATIGSGRGSLDVHTVNGDIGIMVTGLSSPCILFGPAPNRHWWLGCGFTFPNSEASWWRCARMRFAQFGVGAGANR